MKDDQVKSYWSHEVAKLLDISTSTLRKWSLALEAVGYSFVRDENDKRAYMEHDLIPLTKMRELLADGMGMENAAKAVSLRFSEQQLESRTMVVRDDIDRSSERYDMLLQQNTEMRTLIEQLAVSLQESQKELQQELQDQRAYIQDSIRSRDEHLMQVLRTMLEEKKRSTRKWWKFNK